MAEYVEREKLIRRLQKASIEAWKMNLTTIWNEAIDIAKQVPTADVAPIIHARWIEEDGVQTCSNCGEEHEWIDYRAPYCDTCGAKMDAKTELTEVTE